MRQQFRFHRPLFLCLALAVISNVKPILMPPLVRRDNEKVILFPFEAIWVILGTRWNHESVSKSTLQSYAVNTAFRYYLTQIKFLSLSLNISDLSEDTSNLKNICPLRLKSRRSTAKTAPLCRRRSTQKISELSLACHSSWLAAKNELTSITAA